MNSSLSFCNTAFFDSLRISCQDRKIPLISSETQDFLLAQLYLTKPKRVLEIGSAIGFSTCRIAQAIDEREGNVISFEVSYPAYLEALKNLKTINAYNAKIYPFDFNYVKLEQLFFDKFDLVFIDAQKSQYGDYIEKIQPFLTDSCTVILDDVIKYKDKLSGLYGFLDRNQINYELFAMEEGDGVMFINQKKT